MCRRWSTWPPLRCLCSAFSVKIRIFFKWQAPFLILTAILDFDAVDPWQACNKDIRACKDKYQDKIVFVNGFDNQGVLDKPGVTEAELEREIMRTLETLAPGNGYLEEMDVFDRSKQAIFQKCVATYNERNS